MTEYTPVIDITKEFIDMAPYELNDYIRSLGKGALVGISYQILEEESDMNNRMLLRRTKAFVERGPERLAMVLATEEQISIEPNVFYSGVVRVSPDIDA